MSFEWMNRAACKGLTHKMFPTHHNDKTYVVEAKAICDSCPVRRECLDYALEFTASEMHGIWAGMTSNQLAREQRTRGITSTRPTAVSILSGAFDKKPPVVKPGGKKRGPKPKSRG